MTPQKKISPKEKIFAICLDLYNKNPGERFSDYAVEQLAGGSNKQTIKQYAEAFRQLIPFVQVMPSSSVEVWEAMKLLEEGNKALKERAEEKTQSEIDAITQLLVTSETKVAVMQAELNDTKQSITEISDENLHLKLAVNELEATKKADAQKANIAFENQQSEHKSVLDALESTHKANVDTLQTEISFHVDQILALKEIYNKNEQAATARETELKTTVSELRVQLDTANKTLSEANMELSNVKHTLSHTKQELALLQQNMELSTESYKVLEEKYAHIKKMSAKMISDTERLHDKFEDLQKECKDLRGRKPLTFDAYLNKFKNDDSFADVIKEHETTNASMSGKYRMTLRQYYENRR